jgi:methionyl-tRNA formyltransferase
MKAREAFRIVFMGTPAFAVPALEMLHQSGYDLAAVVTAPDKPGGRGLKPQAPAVKQWAMLHQVPVLQPNSLKDNYFISTLARMQADLFVVVAFRMLPEMVWKMPALGTINLHASLLPQYRGAAPINRAIMDGETKTGLTTFFIDQEIDTGKLLSRKEVPIGTTETAGELHDRLMKTGAGLLLETVDAIRENNVNPVDQNLLIPIEQKLRKAPKIFKDDCRITWDQKTTNVYNQIRGLSPYPAAFTIFQSPEGALHTIKVFNASPGQKVISGKPGSILTVNNTQLFVSTADGSIELLKLQLSGKARMDTNEFLKGFRIGQGWIAI